MNVIATRENTLLDLARGWRLVPAGLNKHPMCQWARIRDGEGGWRDSPNLVTTEAEMDEASKIYRNASWLVALQSSGLMIVDCDREPLEATEGSERRLATATIRRLQRAAGGAWCRTKSGGFHFFFLNPDGRYKTRPRGKAAVLGDCRPRWIEVKAASSSEGGSGGLAMLYNRESHADDPIPLPDDLAEVLRPCLRKARRVRRDRLRGASPRYLSGVVADWKWRLAHAEEGERDNTAWLACWTLARLMPSRLWEEPIVEAGVACGLTEEVMREKAARACDV